MLKCQYNEHTAFRGNCAPAGLGDVPSKVRLAYVLNYLILLAFLPQKTMLRYQHAIWPTEVYKMTKIAAVALVQ